MQIVMILSVYFCLSIVVVILILSLQCCNKDEQGKVFANRDAVYVLCYAILMLNTDQYSAQVRKRMSLEVHVRYCYMYI